MKVLEVHNAYVGVTVEGVMYSDYFLLNYDKLK